MFKKLVLLLSLITAVFHPAFAATLPYYEDFNDGASEFYAQAGTDAFEYSGGKYIYVRPRGGFPFSSSWDTIAFMHIDNGDALRPGFKIQMKVTPSVTIDPSSGTQMNISFGFNYRSPDNGAHYRGEYHWFARDGLGVMPPHSRMRITGTVASEWVETGIANASPATITMTFQGAYGTGNSFRFRFTVSDGFNTTSMEFLDNTGYDFPPSWVGLFLSGSDDANNGVTPHIAFDDFSVVADTPFTTAKDLISTILPGGIFSLTGKGFANATYRMESSPDLQAWTPVQDAATDANGAFQFSDGDAPSFSQRFYHVLLP